MTQIQIGTIEQIDEKRIMQLVMEALERTEKILSLIRIAVADDREWRGLDPYGTPP